MVVVCRQTLGPLSSCKKGLALVWQGGGGVDVKKAQLETSERGKKKEDELHRHCTQTGFAALMSGPGFVVRRVNTEPPPRPASAAPGHEGWGRAGSASVHTWAATLRHTTGPLQDWGRGRGGAQVAFQQSKSITTSHPQGNAANPPTNQKKYGRNGNNPPNNIPHSNYIPLQILSPPPGIRLQPPK